MSRNISSELVPVLRKDGVTLYGKVIDHKTGKLGRYEVHHDMMMHDDKEYLDYSVAETRFNALIGAKSNGTPEKTRTQPNKSY